jgi:hypothetical protein
MRRALPLLPIALMLSLVETAHADMSISFDFMNYGGSQDLNPKNHHARPSVVWTTDPHTGNTKAVTFEALVNGVYSTDPDYTVTASGYELAKAAAPLILPKKKSGWLDLYAKSKGDAKEGLGLDATGNHEIGIDEAIKLDFTKILSIQGAGPYIRLTISSIQKKEGFSIYDSTGLGSTPIASGFGHNKHDVVQTLYFDSRITGDILYVTGNSAGKGEDNVLIQSAGVTFAIPEPSSLVIATIAGLGVIGYGSRRSRAAKAC